MAANKVTYNVGTSNKFSAFYDENDLGRYGRTGVNPSPGPTKHYSNPPVRYNPPPYAYRVPFSVNQGFSVRDPGDNVPTYTDDNVYDNRARGRRPNRRYRGNPNAPRRFDRVSGTGRGKEMKKHGEGGHNWGSVSKDSKLSVKEGDNEDNELTKDLDNLTLNGNENTEVNKETNKENNKKESTENKERDNNNNKDKSPEKSKKNDMMDFESYKLLQQSKRTNLPTFTVNDKKAVSTDTDLQNHGYVRYVKESQETRLQEKVKVFNYHPNTNTTNVLPSHPSSFRDRERDRRQKRYTGQPKKSNNARVRMKAPDLTDLRLFPCLDMKS